MKARLQAEAAEANLQAVEKSLGRYDRNLKPARDVAHELQQQRALLSAEVQYALKGARSSRRRLKRLDEQEAQLLNDIGAASVGANTGHALQELLAPKPQRSWCLSREETKKRAAEVRSKFGKEDITYNADDVDVSDIKEELANVDRVAAQILKKNTAAKKAASAKIEKEKDKKRAEVRAQREKEVKRRQEQAAKKQRKKKVMKDRKTARAQDRAKKGKKKFVHAGGKRSKKKTRH